MQVGKLLAHSRFFTNPTFNVVFTQYLPCNAKVLFIEKAKLIQLQDLPYSKDGNLLLSHALSGSKK